MSSPVALILGAGANAGQAIGRAFAAKGYKVALVARSIRDNENDSSSSSSENELRIQADFAEPSSLPAVFAQVKAKLGVPSVVVFNAAKVYPNDPKNPLTTLSLDDLTTSFNINTLSLFVAAQQAVLGFQEASSSSVASPTFIYTGNCTNTKPIAYIYDLGITKSASAHVIRVAAESYQDRKYKFYYADEREDDGTPMYKGITASAHADYYVELAEGESQGPWLQTFVAGKGYKQF